MGVVKRLSAATVTPPPIIPPVAATAPPMSMPPTREDAGAPIASRSWLEARSRMTSTGGEPGSTTVVAGTPASSAMLAARLNTPLTRLALITAEAPGPEPDAAVTASSVRCPFGPARDAAICTAAVLARLPSTAQRASAKTLAGTGVADPGCLAVLPAFWSAC